jgi:nucleotide-binding universal stress UspA family protein
MICSQVADRNKEHFCPPRVDFATFLCRLCSASSSSLRWEPGDAAPQEAQDMSIKRILVPLPGLVEHAGEVDMALSAAKALSAHVEALFINPPPPPVRGMRVAEGYAGAAAVPRAVNWFAEEQEMRAREARDGFVRACSASGIPLVADADEPTALPAASWRQAEGTYDRIAAERAAAFDLVVAASAAVLESLKDIAEKSLMQTRRPVLLAPQTSGADLTAPAMIAWDESPECWHALSAALPFLRLARSIDVVSVDRNVAARRASQAEALAYLRCHGIGATARVVALHLRSAGETLLAEAAEHDVCLLVMGAYSHSPLREMLLGGATRHILKNAVARPVLMAH